MRPSALTEENSKPERVTKRKKLILELLQKSDPAGFSMLNELRVKARRSGEFARAKSRRSDQKRSFNRSILENFSQLHITKLAEKYGGIDRRLSAGLLARWTAWEMIEEGFLTQLPAAEEMTVIVGSNSCSGILTLKNDGCAVAGSATAFSDLYLVADRPLDSAALENLSIVPWKLLGVTPSGIQQIEKSHPVFELRRLPSEISFEDGTYLSTNNVKVLV